MNMYRTTTFFRFMATTVILQELSSPFLSHGISSGSVFGCHAFGVWIYSIGCSLLTLLILETLDRKKEDDPTKGHFLDRYYDGNDRDEPEHKALQNSNDMRGSVSATTKVCFCVLTSCHPGCHIFCQPLGPESPRAAVSFRFEQVRHNLMRTKPPTPPSVLP
jgi:hypothetical protein